MLAIIALIFAVFEASYGNTLYFPSPNLSTQLKIKEDITDIMNASSECLRNLLNEGLPEYDFPSFDPLEIDEISIDLNHLNSSIISGEIALTNIIFANGTSWQITDLQGEYDEDSSTYTETFGLHYDEISISLDYKLNITLLGLDIWGEGLIFSRVENVTGSLYLKAIVDENGVILQEFQAPISIENYNFTITGFYGDDVLSAEISAFLSDFLKVLVNDNPEFFEDVIGPLIVFIFNALVNDEIGIGIVITMVQRCIIDIINPPEEFFKNYYY